MRCKIIDFTSAKRFYFIFFIIIRIGFSIFYHHTTRIRKLSVRVRNIVTFKKNRSFFGDRIFQSLQNLLHMAARECIVFKRLQFFFVRKFAHLIFGKIQKFFFGADLWRQNLNFFHLQKCFQNFIVKIFFDQQNFGNISKIITILSHQKL